jgi:two-component system sensor histidine kinase KdpD
MVENLLSVTRLRGEASIQKGHELAEELIGEVSRKFKKLYPAIPLRVSIPEEPLFIPMDILLIEQVLINLLENAAVHGRDLTRVEMTAAVSNGEAVFCVDNDGEDADPEVLKHISESDYFLTARRGKSDSKRDMGIGLSLCASIIKAHGGTFSAGKGARGGARFTFSLPMEEISSNVS